MLIFLDTEFTGLGQKPPKLISLGLVDEVGSSFYAELPSESYLQDCSEWVKENVLPLLWGGLHELSRGNFRKLLVAWIEEHRERCILVTDSPDYDFELVKPVLDPWPHNLARRPFTFNEAVMGFNREAWLSGVMSKYHTAERPEHHALHDAFALRAGGAMAAIDRGWRPK